MSALVVTETVTYRGGTGYDTRLPDAWHIADFLSWVIRVVAGVGVVLLDRGVAGRLGLPTEALPASGEGKRHPAAVEARTAGWSVAEIWRWSRFVREGHEVHVGLLDLMDRDYCPLIADGLLDTVGALDAWQQLAGIPYWGDAGDAVNHLIRQTAKCRLNGRPLTPAWHPPAPAAVAGQYARTFRGWRSSGGDVGRFEVGYDATRAYLAAMSVVEVAPLPLKATGRRGFDRRLAGWWLVDLAPWTDPRMPAPWGHYDDGADVDGFVWLTTPDLVLLDALRDAGRHGGYTIIDSYTAKADRAVLRPAAERLREMWDHAGTLHDPNDRAAVRSTIQAGYQAAHGKWRSKAAEIRRPDWAAALVATARTNLWRRIDRAAAAGRWPHRVDGIDTVYYVTDTPDVAPAGIVTDTFPLNTGRATDRLGTFRRKYLTDRTTP